MPKTQNDTQITLWERILTALISSLLSILVCLVTSFILFRAGKGGTDFFQTFFTIYWKGSITFISAAAILGFVLGSARMAELFGIFFRTNKPKDGNWL